MGPEKSPNGFMVLDAPLTLDEQLRTCNSLGYVDGCIVITLGEMMGKGYFALSDLVSERLVGSEYMTNVTFEAVDVLRTNLIVMKVSGCIVEALEDSALEQIKEALLNKVLKAGDRAIMEVTGYDARYLTDPKESVKEELDRMNTERIIEHYKTFVLEISED